MKRYSKMEVAIAWENLNLCESGLITIQHNLKSNKTIEQLKKLWLQLNFPPLLFGMFEQELEYEVVGKSHKFPSDRRDDEV